jgi:hypothetical protein
MNQPLNDIAVDQQLAAKFEEQMLGIPEKERRAPDLGIRSTYFLGMVYKRGGLATARELLTRQPPANTFAFLREQKRPDLIMEYYVVPPSQRPEAIRDFPLTADELTDYSSLFTKQQQEIALWRLNHEF